MILRSHGKGTTKIFALASGYAELYERFCAEYDIFRNYLSECGISVR